MAKRGGSKSSKPKSPASGARQWIRVQMAQPSDVALLRDRLSRKGPLWSEWEYKLRDGRVLIYAPVVPWDEHNRPDPSRRYMAMHLRISPTHPGPFQIEYRRHTEQWWPLPFTGTMEQLAALIDEDPIGRFQSIDQPEWDRANRPTGGSRGEG